VIVPPLVARAREAAAERGFEKSCRDEDGMLLHVLAARRGIARVAEIGTGTGAGTAWLAAALAPGTPLLQR
jgi:predicted O-methyltransferase YrrM